MIFRLNHLIAINNNHLSTSLSDVDFYSSNIILLTVHVEPLIPFQLTF